MQTSKQNPTFFIGLGGHGGDIVDRLAKQIQGRSDWKEIADLNHFIAIDTDEDDLAMKKFIPAENRVWILNFDRNNLQMRAYGESFQEKDERLTYWLPHPEEYRIRYAPRTRTPLTRLSSRLGCYYNIAVEGSIQKVIRNCIQRSIRDGNAFRRDDLNMQFFIFGSVAGSTGSGAFLTISYLVQSLVDRPWTPHITMFLSLPTLFKEKLGGRYNTACANGYAALKELEFLTSRMIFDSNPSYPYRFGAYDHEGIVESRPAGLIYLMDRPSNNLSFDPVESIADVAYLLTFTCCLNPIKDMVTTFECEARKLNLGAYSFSYATLGSHSLLFPRHDIIEYVTRRRLVAILQENVALSSILYRQDGVAIDCSIDYDDPNFSALSELDQQIQIDDRFLQYIQCKYEEERQNEFIGEFTCIVGVESAPTSTNEQVSDPTEEDVRTSHVKGPLLSDGITTLWDVFFDNTGDWIKEVDKLLESSFDLRPNITLDNPSIDATFAIMIEEYQTLHKTIQQEAERKAEHIRSGTFFDDLFQKHNISPIAQRYFLLHLRKFTVGETDDRMFIPPGKDSVDNLMYLSGAVFPPEDLEQTQQHFNALLEKHSQQSFFQLIFDYKNERFTKQVSLIRKKIVAMVEQAKDCLHIQYWRPIEEAFRWAVSKRLQDFRNIHRYTCALIKLETESCVRFLTDPISIDPNAQVAQYTNTVEILYDCTQEKRLWDCLYTDKFSYIHLDTRTIRDMITAEFTTMNTGIAPQNLSERRVVDTIRTNLYNHIKEKFSSTLHDIDMNADQALILEAQYLVAIEEVQRNDTTETGSLHPFSAEYSRLEREELLHRIQTEIPFIERVRAKIVAKIYSVEKNMSVLSDIASHMFKDCRSAEDNFYYCLQTSQKQESSSGLHVPKIIEDNFAKTLLQSRTSAHLDRCDSPSGDEDRIIFFYTQYVLPIFAFDKVGAEMEPHYQRIHEYNTNKRKEGVCGGLFGYDNDWISLHTDWNWEVEKVRLPNLNPMELKAWFVKTLRKKDMTLFFTAFFIEFFTNAEDGSVMYNSDTDSKKIAPNRYEGFELFFRSSLGVDQFGKDKNDLVQEIHKKWNDTIADSSVYPELIQQLQTHLQNAKVQERYARRVMLDGLALYYSDEVDVIETLINDLKSQLNLIGNENG